MLSHASQHESQHESQKVLHLILNMRHTAVQSLMLQDVYNTRSIKIEQNVTQPNIHSTAKRQLSVSFPECTKAAVNAFPPCQYAQQHSSIGMTLLRCKDCWQHSLLTL